jgi:hypothetical protein
MTVLPCASDVQPGFVLMCTVTCAFLQVTQFQQRAPACRTHFHLHTRGRTLTNKRSIKLRLCLFRNVMTLTEEAFFMCALQSIQQHVSSVHDANMYSSTGTREGRMVPTVASIKEACNATIYARTDTGTGKGPCTYTWSQLPPRSRMRLAHPYMRAWILAHVSRHL